MADMMDLDSVPVDPRLADNFDANNLDPALRGQPHIVTHQIDCIPVDFEDDDNEDIASEISDPTSDDLELAANIARYDAQREAFVAQQRADISASVHPVPLAPVNKVGTRPNRKGKKLGPRKAAKPTPDILFRLSHAKEAFERKKYEDTIQMIREIIRINSETYNAWALLSTVHDELGDRDNATMCLMAAAHLVPKNVPSWISAALYALHGVDEMEDGPEKSLALERALTCYSCALTADKTNIEARTGKADVLMMQGHAGQALVQYQKALGYRPLNIRTVRNMADVALDARDTKKGAETAKRAYRHVIDYLMGAGKFEAEEGRFEWSDLRIYLEFFGILEQWEEGAQQLKEISRWLLGRREEGFWERWVDDDREWDLHDNRRIEVPEFEPARFPQDTYGQGLPVDLRARLYVYRCKLRHDYEAMLHLRLLDPAAETAMADFMDFPDCLKEIAGALLEREQPEDALRYVNFYKEIAATGGEVAVDADILVIQGRCHMMSGDKSAAEECFIAAIEDDNDHIEARVQLANMYEDEQEQEGREEAFLLVRQALNLELKSGTKRRRRGGPRGPRKPREKREGQKRSYVPRRLINAEKRRQQDLEMAAEATKNFRLMEEVKEGFAAGDEQATATWMRAAKDLIDDFRSYKDFYPWDKYIKYLGYGGDVHGQAAKPARNMKLAAMAERLRQNLAPTEGQEGVAPKVPVKILPPDHRGISFDKWLDIFLEYAFTLVRAGKRREAYVVCHAARDSIIWSGIDNTFLIHIAWASCAVYAGDEETCVAIARYFMRDYMPGTDSYRMFAAMCRVCQTPVSWYTSGPAQKFILRQIKTMDNIQLKGPNQTGSDNPEGQQLQKLSPQEIGLDICLLTIYGHILFSTTSYVYALSYFARAASLDPHNCLINLSTGLAYLHYALKRQATNRQYLLAQAFAFLFRYYHDRLGDSQSQANRPEQVAVTAAERQEAHFNIARAYSLIGLGNLAMVYYKKVLEEAECDEEGAMELRGGKVGNEDLTLEAAYNVRTMCYLLGDVEGAKAVTERWLVLR
ncbi:transcription factor tau subunit sfc4 [Podospora aff. communis PSN243]|uniref:Transcription factor tau subunit sfc4 n=1 Tax=Podospora aff. communis PSN243 TaxID=3040156 RepID=A0AAV9H862_9PEZI|nr:transcription factor tau subunit sfc4 [Podospora aff. communis PSN243]